MVNGKKQKSNYKLQEGDICSIRIYPTGTGPTNPDNPLPGNTAIDTAINIIETIIDIVIPDPVTTGTTGIIKQPIQGDGSLVESISPIDGSIAGIAGGAVQDSTNTTKTVIIDKSVAQIPQLKGAQNKSIAESRYPIILGEHLLTPMFIGNPYTSIDPTADIYGEKQYYTILLMLGYSKLQVKDIKLGNIIIAKNTEGITDGNIPVYESSPYKNNIKGIEVRQGYSDVTLYPQKVKEEMLNIKLLRPANEQPLVITRFTEKFPQKVQIEFFLNGLFQINSEGTTINKDVSIQIEWSKDGGVSWNPFPQIINSTAYNADGTSTLVLNRKKQMRFVAEKTFSYSESIDATNRVIEIRIKRLTPEATDTSMINDAVVLSSIRTWCFDYEQSIVSGYLVPQVPIIEKDRNKTCRLAIKIEASETLNADIGMINMLVKSYARIWDGNNETWSGTEQPTSNPASLALKLFQHPTLGLYSYTDNKIDLMKFGELYEFCEERDFECNGIITNKKQLKHYIDTILTTCRSYRTLNGKKQSLFIDMPRTTPVTILSNQNIISTANSKEFKDIPDGLRIKFINKYIGYQIDYIYVMLGDKSYKDPDVIFEDVDFPFVTDPAQCWRLGRFILAEKVLRPEYWQRKISIDGNLLFVGALVEIQDDTLSVGIGDGAEITELIIDNGDIVGIKTDGSFNVSDLSKTYGVKIVQANGETTPAIRTAQVIITEASIYSEFTFSTPIPISGVVPTVGDNVSFGIIDRITTQALVTALHRNEEGSFDTTFVPYDPAVYNADTDIIPPFESNVTSPQTPISLEERPPQYITKDELGGIVTSVTVGNTDSPSPDKPVNVIAIAGRDGIELKCSPLSQGMKNSIQKVIWEIKKGAEAEFAVCLETNTVGGTYAWNRLVDGYPEAEDIEDWEIRCRVVNAYNKIGDYSDIVMLNLTHYGTWTPARPSSLSIVAQEKTLTLGFNQVDGSNYYGSTIYTVKLSYSGTTRVEKSGLREKFHIYDFNRSIDGYPEKTEITGKPYLGNYSVIVTAIDIVSGKTNTSNTSAALDTSNYGTWIPTAPSIFNMQSGNRSIVVGWQIPLSSGIYIYGLRFYEIQISKDGTNWYKPETAKTGKVSESDWYNGTGQIRVSGVQFAQSLPLTGQTLGLPVNTTYYYRVRTIGITDEYLSEWSDPVTAIALATGIGDIIAGSVKEAQLDDSSVSNIKIQDNTIVASDKVVTNTITTELLNVLAKNKINNFSVTGTLEGWTTAGTLEDDASGFKKLRFTNSGFLSNVFTVQPNEICSFEFGISCPNYTSLSGLFVGLTAVQSFRQYHWSFVTNKWTAGNVSTNKYFILDYKATTVKYFKTYILGSNVSINDIPAPAATDTTYLILALQLQGTDTTARIRTGADVITPGTYWELYNPQIYSNQGGKVVAQQIITPSLSAIAANIGEITSGILRSVIKAGESKPNVFLDLDTEEFRVGNNPSLEDSNHADAEYLHWKPNLGLFLKLKNLIVDAVASTIRGRFRVRGTTATMEQSVLIVNPESTADPDTNTPANTTDIKTAVRCPAGITGNLTGNASTATLATQALAIKPLDNSITLQATPTSVTRIIKIATVDWNYSGTITITSAGSSIADGIKVYINGGNAPSSGLRLIYGKVHANYGIKKIIVTSDTMTYSSNRNIYAEIVNIQNGGSTTTLGVVETNNGTFTPSMIEVSSVEGTVVDSLELNYLRGEISSYQHVFTKNIIGNLTGNASGSSSNVNSTNFFLNEDANYVNLHTKNGKPLYLNAVNAIAHLYGNPVLIGSAGQKVGILTADAGLYNPSSDFPIAIGGNVHCNNKSITNASELHCKNNGNGDLYLTTAAGSLPGYPADHFATVKTSSSGLFFAIAGVYAFAIETLSGTTRLLTGTNTKLSSVSPFYGAVGNDICDNIKIESPVKDFEYGYCYCEYEGEYKKGNRGIIGITSDTASLHCGSDDGMEAGKDYLPIAIGGFVLAYVDRKYRRGTPLKAKRDGSLTRAYWFTPCWQILATYQEEPKEETWNKAKVNGRTIVRVK